MENKATIFDSLEEEIMQSDLSEAEKNRRLSALLKASSKKISVLLIGATSSGKSSTINALFNTSVAKVGFGVDPETKDIEEYELGNLHIFDSPGLGEGIEEDESHIEQIVRKLSEVDDDGELLIDLVLVVLDASSKDMSVSLRVLNEVLIPCLGEDESHRILVALNKSDMAMMGRHWDSENNVPDSVLKGFLTKKANSVKKRIYDATGVEVEPICYSAGYSDEDEEQKPYNLSKLLYYILINVPNEKRLILVDNLNENPDNWLYDDEEEDYGELVRGSFFESLLSGIGTGAEKGAVTGGIIIGVPGMIVGGLVGGVLGFLRGLVIEPLSRLGK